MIKFFEIFNGCVFVTVNLFDSCQPFEFLIFDDIS